MSKRHKNHHYALYRHYLSHLSLINEICLLSHIFASVKTHLTHLSFITGLQLTTIVNLFKSYLVHSANLPKELYVLLALILFLFYFLMNPLRPIISGSTGLIFTIFSPYGRNLLMDYGSGPLFSISQGTLPWQPI